jgi:hypothetical protein
MRRTIMTVNEVPGLSTIRTTRGIPTRARMPLSGRPVPVRTVQPQRISAARNMLVARRRNVVAKRRAQL